MQMDIQRLIWWPEDATIATLAQEIRVFSKTKDPLGSQGVAIQSILPFSSRSAIDAVVYSAFDEDCISEPSLTPEERKALEEVFEGIKTSADIEIKDIKLALLCRHLEALKYMLYSQHTTLSMEIILHTHRIMMGEDAGAGNFRRGPACATNFQYLDAELIPGRMSEALAAYKADDVSNQFESAARLFYHVVHCIHPFVDGNGRIGRLLVSFVLMTSGVTRFAIPLYDGTRKSRRHYEKTICHFQRLNKPWVLLSLYILGCTHRSSKSFSDDDELMLSQVAGSQVLQEC
jgi:Fic family protein